MKKIAVLLTAVIFLASCAGRKQTAVATPPAPTVDSKPEKVKTYAHWNSGYVKYTSEAYMKDTTIWYFGANATLVKDIDRSMTGMENGVLKHKDSTEHVVKKIAEYTKGKLKEIRQQAGSNKKIMVVVFDTDDQTYTLEFFEDANGDFVLNGKIKLIYNSEVYPVIAVISKPCFLLVEYQKDQGSNFFNGQAKGVTP